MPKASRDIPAADAIPAVKCASSIKCGVEITEEDFRDAQAEMESRRALLKRGMLTAEQAADGDKRLRTVAFELEYAKRMEALGLQTDTPPWAARLAESLNDQVSKLSQALESLRKEVKKDVSDLRKEVKKDVSDLRKEVKRDVSGLQKELQQVDRGLDNMRADIAMQHLRTENAAVKGLFDPLTALPNRLGQYPEEGDMPANMSELQKMERPKLVKLLQFYELSVNGDVSTLRKRLALHLGLSRRFVDVL